MEDGTVFADRFEIEALAGVGGMGSVYRARDRVTAETVALKVLREPGVRVDARFEREARLLEQLQHPNIVRHVAHGTTTSGEAYLAMEWLSGVDLGSQIARGPMDVSETLSIARQVAEALAFAHGQGVVHRDIKPSNLFLC